MALSSRVCDTLPDGPSDTKGDNAHRAKANTALRIKPVQLMKADPNSGDHLGQEEILDFGLHNHLINGCYIILLCRHHGQLEYPETDSYACARNSAHHFSLVTIAVHLVGHQSLRVQKISGAFGSLGRGDNHSLRF